MAPGAQPPGRRSRGDAIRPSAASIVPSGRPPGERQSRRLDAARMRSSTTAPSRPGQGARPEAVHDDGRVQLQLCQPTAVEGELGDDGLLGLLKARQIEQEVTERVEDGHTVDELDWTHDVGMGSQHDVRACLHHGPGPTALLRRDAGRVLGAPVRQDSDDVRPVPARTADVSPDVSAAAARPRRDGRSVAAWTTVLMAS